MNQLITGAGPPCIVTSGCIWDQMFILIGDDSGLELTRELATGNDSPHFGFISQILISSNDLSMGPQELILGYNHKMSTKTPVGVFEDFFSQNDGTPTVAPAQRVRELMLAGLVIPRVWQGYAGLRVTCSLHGDWDPQSHAPPAVSGSFAV